jgi:uncharacterized protein YbjT (DUF2867 family)
MKHLILVTGATGNIGRPLLDLLTAGGADVRAVVLKAKSGSTNAERFKQPGISRAAALPAHVEVVEGDLSQPETVARALTGVTGLFINPRAAGSSIRELLSLARERGVARVVTLSAINVDDDLDKQPSRINGDRNKEVEDAVTQSGLEWASLRSSYYAFNTVSLWAAQIQAGDVVRGPYGAWAAAPLHERDLAGVAARALLTDDLVGRQPMLTGLSRRPMLTGPQSLTQREMVDAVGDAIGRRLRYEEISPATAKRGMVAQGLSEQFATAFLSMLADSAGSSAFVSTEVETILGRPALAYAQWAKDHADAFRIPSS